MDAANYSLLQASLEVLGLSLMAFILGILTCALLRKLGICCRARFDDEPSLFALKEPAAFDVSPTAPTPISGSTSTPTFAFNNASLVNTSTTIPAPVAVAPAQVDVPPISTRFEKPIPEPLSVPIPEPIAIPKPELTTPTIEVTLPNPAPITSVVPELAPLPTSATVSTATTTEATAAPETNSGYVVDINTLLRRSPETPPVATIAAATKHQSYDPNTGRVAHSVSIADLLNTQTDLIDNLRKLEGITPRIEAILNEAGIKNYHALSKTDPNRLKQILEAAGEQFKHHDPQSWPFQAELAAKGEWTRLQDYQSYLQSNKTES